MDEIVKVVHLKKSFYLGDEGRRSVLEDVSFSVKGQEILGIMGKSGCGKTTLLKMIGALEYMTEGDILIEGESMARMDEEQRSKLRRNTIGFIFQDYMLMDSLSVEDNIILPRLIDNPHEKRKYDDVKEVGEILEIADLMKRYPGRLSGGEKQRVAIARALISDPKIILADEPTGNLDPISTDLVMEYLQMINVKLKKTFIVVTHDAYVASYCNRVLFLQNGTVGIELQRNGTRENFCDAIKNQQRSL